MPENKDDRRVTGSCRKCRLIVTRNNNEINKVERKCLKDSDLGNEKWEYPINQCFRETSIRGERTICYCENNYCNKDNRSTDVCLLANNFSKENKLGNNNKSNNKNFFW